jgi:hypothetical protein
MRALASERLTVARQSLRLLRLRGRAPRIALLALAAVLCLLGLREIVFPEPTPPAPPAPRVVVDQAAQALAVQFARAYLSFDPNRPERHAEAMAALVPQDLGDDAGAVAPDSEKPTEVLWAQVVQDQPALAGGRIVTVAVQTSVEDGPVYLGVPLRRAPGGVLSLAGYPSFVGPPATATDVDLPEHEEVDDAALAEVSRRAVSNYLAGSSENLRADLAPHATVALPTVRLRVGEVRDVTWADPGRSAVLVTVEAEGQGGATYTLTYDLAVTQEDGRWRVLAIEVNPNLP